MKDIEKNCHRQGDFIAGEDSEGSVKSVFKGYDIKPKPNGYYTDFPPNCEHCGVDFYYTNLSHGWVHPYYNEGV